MSKIFKYELKITDQQTIQMPLGATILSADQQAGGLYLWAEVDPTNPPSDRTFQIIGTGNPIPNVATCRRFIDTVVIGAFVWHVFERIDV